MGKRFNLIIFLEFAAEIGGKINLGDRGKRKGGGEGGIGERRSSAREDRRTSHKTKNKETKTFNLGMKSQNWGS